MERYKVKENSSLERDTFSKAIINTNQEAYKNAKIKALKAKENSQLLDKINNLEDKIQKQDILLQQILDKLNGITHNT